MFINCFGLCLLGIGGAPTSVIKLLLENHIFTFLTFSPKQPAGGTSYYARRLSKPRPSYLFKFWQNFEYEKIQKFCFCLQDL